MTESNRHWCAWLLREVWGKSGNLRPEDYDRLEPLGMGDETPLHICLRVAQIKPSSAPSFSEEAREYYRQEARRVLEDITD